MKGTNDEAGAYCSGKGATLKFHVAIPLREEQFQRFYDSSIFPPISLNPSEIEVYRTCAHWIVFSWPLVLALLLVFPGLSSLIGVFEHGGSLTGSVILATAASFFLLTAAAITAMAIEGCRSTKAVVTNRRVILRAGVLWARVAYVDFNKVERVVVRQGALGKRLCFGTVFLLQVGEQSNRISNIPHPIKFFQCLQAQLNCGTDEKICVGP